MNNVLHVTMDEKLTKRLDFFLEENGFKTKSEAIRFIINQGLKKMKY